MSSFYRQHTGITSGYSERECGEAFDKIKSACDHMRCAVCGEKESPSHPFGMAYFDDEFNVICVTSEECEKEYQEFFSELKKKVMG